MAIFSLSVRVVSRSAGRCAVNAAAYRRGVRMYDQRSATHFGYLAKADVACSELTLPPNAPAWVGHLAEMHRTEPTRAAEALWNRVELFEKRKDAQLARDLLLVLPRELTLAQQQELVRAFLVDQVCSQGVVCDWSIHNDEENHNPHCHALLTMRPLTEEGFGARKVLQRDPASGKPLRDQRGKLVYAFGDKWGSTELLQQLREQWAVYQNARLAEHGHEARVDHRSFRERGIDLVPSTHLGVHAVGMAEKGKPSERVAARSESRQENARRFAQQPEQLLDLVTHKRAVFTRSYVQRELAQYLDEPAIAAAVLERAMASPRLVQLSPERRNSFGRVVERARYSTREMIALEQRLVDDAQVLAGRTAHKVRAPALATVLRRHAKLSPEQLAAVEHIVQGGAAAAIAGAAGAGKSTTLAAAREAWEHAGYTVRGAALAGKAADGLAEAAGIPSRTLHSLEYAWSKGRDRLTAKDILVIDEAGMVGSAQLGRVLAEIRAAGAKVVLVGDAQQLQPIEAGAAFRAIVERLGVAEIATIRRQQAEWARDASMHFAGGRVATGLRAYTERGHVQLLATRDDAKAALARDWLARGRIDDSIILAHTNEDVQALNAAVRQSRREAGQLGEGRAFSTSKGQRDFAAGDRIVFLENDRELGVKNGSLGTVRSADSGRLSIVLDAGATVSVRQELYDQVDHGYAVTIHKAQGATVNHAYVLAGPSMDRHLAYVAMTRHRQTATLYAGVDDFGDQAGLAKVLGRARPKESSLDFAERRGIETRLPFVENARAWLGRQRERLAENLEKLERAVRAQLGLPVRAPTVTKEPTSDRLAGALTAASRTADELHDLPSLAKSAKRRERDRQR